MKLFAQNERKFGNQLLFSPVKFLKNPSEVPEGPLNLRIRKICGDPCDLPYQLKGDSSRLKQVLINLIQFAFDKSTRNKIIVLAAFDYKKSLLKVHVMNTGTGISFRQLEKIQK